MLAVLRDQWATSRHSATTKLYENANGSSGIRIRLKGSIKNPYAIGAKIISTKPRFLKEIQSEKKIYAYDTYAGFPPVEDKNDSIEKFKDLYDSGNITKEHYMQVQSLIEIRKNFKDNKKSR